MQYDSFDSRTENGEKYHFLGHKFGKGVRMQILLRLQLEEMFFSAGFVDLWSNSQKQKKPKFHQKTHEKTQKVHPNFPVETLDGNLETNIHRNPAPPGFFLREIRLVDVLHTEKSDVVDAPNGQAVWPGSESRQAIESIALVCRKALGCSLRAG